MARLPHDEPVEANADEGEVVVDGPAGLAASFTPKAAALSADAIARAAEEAEKQAQARA